MKVRRFAVPAVLLVAALGVPAHATGGSIGHTIDGSGLAYISVTVGGTAPLNGVCKYARYTAGIGGGGVDYQIVGAGSATGTYKGIPVVATGVRCRFFLGSQIIVSGPEYLPGAASETDVDYPSSNASGGLICVTVYGTLRQTPPGEPDNVISSGEQC